MTAGMDSKPEPFMLTYYSSPLSQTMLPGRLDVPSVVDSHETTVNCKAFTAGDDNIYFTIHAQAWHDQAVPT